MDVRSGRVDRVAAVDLPSLVVNLGVFVATAGAAAIAWWQAVDASRSKASAQDAEHAALRAQQDASASLAKANEIAMINMRAPFGSALTEYASALLQARSVGADSKRLVSLMAEHSRQLTDTGVRSGEDTTQLTSWVAAYIVQMKFNLASPNAMVQDAAIIDDRIRYWIRDPVATIELIRRDPRANLRGYRGFEDM